MKKSGTVYLVGRPNAGKSTLVNALINQKVSITSPLPQTTRFRIETVYEDEKGQIIFVDTPGIFEKVKDTLTAKINKTAENSFHEKADCFVYVVDHTRRRETEENKIIGMLRKINRPKILAINKIDIKKPSYIEQYLFLREEFDEFSKISALKRKNLKLFLEKIFEKLPKQEKIIDTSKLTYPVLNIDSKTFIAEIIREKIYLLTRQEVPYTQTVQVKEITEKDNNVLYIKADILTLSDHYKRMLIGKKGSKIKAIGSYARKELELATNKKIYLDVNIQVNSHWVENI